MAKTANVYARIEPELKEEAELILEAVGVPASNAITMFYKQIVLHRGLPFEVKLPTRPIRISELSDEELNAELELGYQDILAGRVKPVDEVFASIKRVADV